MYCSKFVFVFFFFTLCFSAGFAKELNFQNQFDFLDSLLKEIESTSKKNFTTVSQTEIEEYIEDIKKLKQALNNIKIEKSKTPEDETELQKLVDQYNQKIAELKKAYKFILSKSNKNNCKNEFSTSRLHSVFEVDPLDCEKKRRKIGDDKKFEPLELIEVTGDIPSKLNSEKSYDILIKNEE